MFEPSKEVDSTVEMTVRCYRWCERTKLHTEFLVWFIHCSRQKITKNPTPRTVYLKMTRGVDWHPKNQNKHWTGREKNNANACGKKRRPRKKLSTRACGKVITKDKSTQMQELNEKWLPLSGKQTVETNWPDGKDGEHVVHNLHHFWLRSRRKRDGKKSSTPTQ